MRAHYSRGTPPIYVLRAREMGEEIHLPQKGGPSGLLKVLPPDHA